MALSRPDRYRAIIQTDGRAGAPLTNRHGRVLELSLPHGPAMTGLGEKSAGTTKAAANMDSSRRPLHVEQAASEHQVSSITRFARDTESS